MKSLRIIVILIGSFCFSCNSNNSTCRLIDLDTVSGMEEVDIESLFTDLRLIRLETENGLFLPSYFRYWLGEEHIIIFTSDQIIQYTSQGVFVRILKQRGRGPDEFSYISCFDVDETNNVLYYSDNKSRDKLTLLDLNNGNHLDYILLPEDIELNEYGIKILPDGRLLCFNSLYEESKNLCYYLEEGEKYGKSIIRPQWMRESPPAAYWAYIGYFDDKISYMSGIVDTLFRVNNEQLIPEYHIEMEARYHFADRPSGFFPAVAFENTRYLLIKKKEVLSQFDKGLNRLSRRLLEEYVLYLYDKKESRLTAVEDLCYKSLKLPGIINIIQSGSNASVLLEAGDLIKWREDLLPEDQAGNKLPDNILEIINNVDEIDNSYIMAGKI